MTEQVQSFIADLELFSKSDKLLLAVSGGVDSVTLAYLLQHLGYDFHLAHVNYRLRGADSDADEVLVRNLAAQMQVPIHVMQADIAKEQKRQGISVQMAARNVRYDWLTRLLKKEGLQYMVTAHHADDSLETSIFNLTKGTGIKGLRGIKSAEGLVRRPLLCLGKAEIEAYAQEHSLQWREDASNTTSKYQRNKIRNLVIPHLKEINDNLTNTYLQTQKRLLATEELVLDQVNRVRKEYLSTKGGLECLDLQWLQKKPTSLLILSELLGVYGFSFAVSEQIFDAVFGESGKLFESKTHRLNLDRKQALIQPGKISIEATNLEIPDHAGEYELGDASIRLSFVSNLEEYERDPRVGYLDRDKLTFPLKIRSWQSGDVFKPLGMSGHKKVSDLLVDLKMPILLKSSVRILLTDDEVCWVVGIRIDDRFKITEHTRHIVKLEFMTK